MKTENVPDVPRVALSHLDQLWFQVGGTLCNLTCHHCFINCSPKNDSFQFLSLSDVKRRLEESIELGVKEYYFTGGEPFLNRDLVPILVETLKYGPATVLTNATVLREESLSSLQQAEAASRYSLEFRVSIDGFTAETNDPIRGEGTFERAMTGVKRLVAFGFLPIITATRTWPDDREQDVVGGFARMLKRSGYSRPRLKILPSLKLGAEADRTHGYRADERITNEMFDDFDASQLICEHSRIVTNRGIYVCPILIESPDANMGEQLAQTTGSFPLAHGACFTCYQYGSICSNPSSGLSKVSES